MSELIVVPDKDMPSLYRVRYEEGLGATPDYLKGLFSTRIAAKKRIMIYESRPKPKPIEYKGQKKLSNEEEAELFAKIQIEVEAENNGKEQETQNKSEGGTEPVHSGTDNGSQPSIVS